MGSGWLASFRIRHWKMKRNKNESAKNGQAPSVALMSIFTIIIKTLLLLKTRPPLLSLFEREVKMRY